MSSTTVRAGIDSYVDSSRSSMNLAGSTRLVIEADGTNCYAYIWFKNPAPAGATVSSATLRLYGAGTNGSMQINCNKVTESWNAGKLNYNNRPAGRGVGTTTSRTQANDVDTEWDIDVTTHVQAWCDGQANFGFVLSTTTSTRAVFFSMNYTSHHPELDVTWSDAPFAPTDLAPSGGRAVSIAKPVLRWTYGDPHNSVLTSVQVQINGTNSFTAPAFDSGTVATTIPQLDLSTTAYAGISVGGTAYWRARVQDAAGRWSDWSDPSQFTRTSQGTLAITNPPVGATVTDVTPPIIWSLTGVTQSQFQLYVALASDPSHALYHKDWTSGTANSWTIPKGILVDQGATYRVAVYTRDTVDRETTPGDPGYLRAQRDFTFVESATVAPVTRLAASQPSGLPSVQLDWNRSTAPDRFTIRRANQTIDSNLNPADLLVSGTSYRYTDTTAPAFEEHGWAVQCVVNGVTSASNPVVNFTPEIQAVWLIDPIHNVHCPIFPTDTATFDMPEQAGTYEPIESKAVVRVVQSQRGLEGTISGRIIDYAGFTAEHWVTNMFSFKAAPATQFQLLLGKQNLRVVIGAVVISPLPGSNPDDRAVSFQFWSQDGPTQT